MEVPADVLQHPLLVPLFADPRPSRTPHRRRHGQRKSIPPRIIQQASAPVDKITCVCNRPLSYFQTPIRQGGSFDVNPVGDLCDFNQDINHTAWYSNVPLKQPSPRKQPSANSSPSQHKSWRQRQRQHDPPSIARPGQKQAHTDRSVTRCCSAHPTLRPWHRRRRRRRRRQPRASCRDSCFPKHHPRLRRPSPSRLSSNEPTSTAFLPIAPYVKPTSTGTAPSELAALSATSPSPTAAASKMVDTLSTRSSASTGCVACVRRVRAASSCTSSTCARCPSATSSCAMASAPTATSVCTCISTPRASCRPVHTTNRASARWDPGAPRNTSARRCARIISPVSALMGQIARRAPILNGRQAWRNPVSRLRRRMTTSLFRARGSTLTTKTRAPSGNLETGTATGIGTETETVVSSVEVTRGDLVAVVGSGGDGDGDGEGIRTLAPLFIGLASGINKMGGRLKERVTVPSGAPSKHQYGASQSSPGNINDTTSSKHTTTQTSQPWPDPPTTHKQWQATAVRRTVFRHSLAVSPRSDENISMPQSPSLSRLMQDHPRWQPWFALDETWLWHRLEPRKGSHAWTQESSGRLKAHLPAQGERFRLWIEAYFFQEEGPLDRAEEGRHLLFYCLRPKET